MSTGVNLGFDPSPCFVDVTSDAVFANLVNAPDAAKIEQARALVLAGVDAAIRDGLAPSAVAVLMPGGSAALLQLRADAAVGDHTANAALATTHAAACDRAHTNGVKVVYVLNLTDPAGAPAESNEVVQAIAGLQRGGVEPDAWVLDQPIDPSAAPAITEQARCGGRDHVALALRGQGLVADETYGEPLGAWATGAVDAGVATDQIAAALTRAAATATSR